MPFKSGTTKTEPPLPKRDDLHYFILMYCVKSCLWCFFRVKLQMCISSVCAQSCSSCNSASQSAALAETPALTHLPTKRAAVSVTASRKPERGLLSCCSCGPPEGPRHPLMKYTSPDSTGTAVGRTVRWEGETARTKCMEGWEEGEKAREWKQSERSANRS